MRALLPKLSGAAALAFLAAPALAHDGHPHGGLLAGLMHPIGGADHLVATVGLGLVAGWIAARGTHGSEARGAAGARAGARVGVAAASGLVAGALWSALAGAVPGLPAASGGLVEHAVAVGLLAVALALLSIERIGARGLAAFAALVAVPHGWLPHSSRASRWRASRSTSPACAWARRRRDWARSARRRRAGARPRSAPVPAPGCSRRRSAEPAPRPAAPVANRRDAAREGDGRAVVNPSQPGGHCDRGGARRHA
jgi:urease accessory protein